MAPRDNARRMLNRRFYAAEQGPQGTRDTVRAAPEPQVVLRCMGPVAHRFRAAEQMRCPMCHNMTEIVGHV